MNKMMAMLVSVCTNICGEEDNKEYFADAMDRSSSKLRFDWDVWYEYVDALKSAGVNTLVMDLGDGIRFNSHPEIAVEGAWSVEQLKIEIARLRGMGFELIPKLNFSAAHDYWLKDYARMVSTEPYYRVCSDLIAEVCEIFKPEYFHIGMDEENYPLQEKYDYVVIRQHDALWKDIRFLVGEVEKHNVRVIMWADHAREHLEDFIENCPKSVVPMIWYYDRNFYGELEEFYFIRVRPMKALIAAGFDIMTTGSCYFHWDSFSLLAEYCRNNLNQDKFLGLCQTNWLMVLSEEKEKLIKSAETVENALKVFEGTE